MLVTHPKVMDAAVFGIPDDEMGRAVKGVVRTVDPADATENSAGAARLAARQTGALQVPAVHLVRAQLPRADTGKLYKQELISKYS